MIEIEILNHEELAKRHSYSFFARVARRFVRGSLKWRVERTVAEEIKRNLEAQGIKVTVYVK